MNTLLSIGIILLGGLLAEKLVSRYNVPAITSYILLGIILGPHTFKITGTELIAVSDLFSNLVLGFIAFHIGENFSLENFRKIGKAVIVISILESLGAWFFVSAGLHYLLGMDFHISIIFGAIAAATAPAATMLVVRQYRSKGKFTDILLSIVAIDDAWGIMAFSLSLAVAENLHNGHIQQGVLFTVLLKAFLEILLSIAIGIIIAMIISATSSAIKKRGDMLIFVLGAVIANSGLAISFHLSPLLANMAFGAWLVNRAQSPFRFFEPIKSVDWPFYIIFYVLAGANLDVTLLWSIGLTGLTYLFLRVAGKMTGAFIGGQVVSSDSAVKKYMGLALIPQAGVALGLAMIARAEFPAMGADVFTTIAATTVIYEILGPAATRYALARAGDIRL